MSDMRQALSTAINARSEEMIDLLQQLIAIATPNPPGDNYGVIVELLGTRLEETGVQVDTVYVPTEVLAHHDIDGEAYPRPALIGRYGGSMAALRSTSTVISTSFLLPVPNNITPSAKTAASMAGGPRI